MELKIQPKMYFVLQAKCPLLYTNWNQTQVRAEVGIAITMYALQKFYVWLWSINSERTLLMKQSTFSHVTLFPLEGYSRNSASSKLSACLRNVVRLAAICVNKGHFSWRTKYVVNCTSSSIPTLTLQILNYVPMPYKTHTFGGVLGEQSNL
jgi:hypothetical protein